VWGFTARGVDLSQFTNQKFKWMGCMNGRSSCKAHDFYCTDGPDGLEFGSKDRTGGAGSTMRAMLGNEILTSNPGGVCCKPTDAPGSCLMNSLDKDQDIETLCQQLGFASGTVERVNYNGCPEAHWDGTSWTQDGVGSVGYGRVFKCRPAPGDASVSHDEMTTTVPPITVPPVPVPAPPTPEPSTPATTTQAPSTKATCQSLLVDYKVWGYTARGIDLSKFTNQKFKWMGCVDGRSSCPSTEFYCQENGNTLEWGHKPGTKAMRAVLGNEIISHSYNDKVACCGWNGGPSDADGHCLLNSPDKPADVQALCTALGFTSGKVEKITTNSCPEAHWDGATWTQDFVMSTGHGKVYKCTG